MSTLATTTTRTAVLRERLAAGKGDATSRLVVEHAVLHDLRHHLRDGHLAAGHLARARGARFDARSAGCA